MQMKVSMKQVHGVRNVCEKFEGNVANHSRVESRTKLQVTDGRTDGQTDGKTDRQADFSMPPPSTTLREV